MARVVLAVLMVVMSAAGMVAGAQTRAAEGRGPAFDVASIKTSRTRTDSRGVSTQPGRLTITGLTVREIVAFAYGIPNPLRYSRISSRQKWLDSDRFDIIAKAEEGASADRLRLMLRALLAVRFRLVARNTTAEMPIYALRLARNDGALGPRLRRTADIDCGRFMADRGGVPPPLPRDPKDVPTCVIRAEPGLIVARSRTMQDLTTVAFPRVVEDRVVVDRTGLTGSYDVLLEWAPDPRPFATAADLPPGLPAPPPPPSGGPSIFTAIQEQLGLRLQSDKGPVDVLMIDRVERPSED